MQRRFALSASKNQSASIQPHLRKNQSKIGGIIRQIGGQSVRKLSKVQGKKYYFIRKVGGRSVRNVSRSHSKLRAARGKPLNSCQPNFFCVSRETL